MAWETINNNNHYWILDGIGMRVKNGTPLTEIVQLNYIDVPKKFKSNKNYQIVTTVTGLNDTPGTSFSVVSGWNTQIDYNSTTNNLPQSAGVVELQYFSKPSSDVTLTKYASYLANGNFGTASSPTCNIRKFELNEVEFDIRGYAVKRTGVNVLGWVYHSSSSTFNWTYIPTSTIYPINGSLSNQIFIKNNFISRRTNLEKFNMTFNYTGSPSLNIKAYVGSDLPIDTTATPTYGNLIANLTQSGTFSFYGLVGNFIYFVAGTTSNSTGSLSIRNVEISGGYHDGNNELYHFDNSYNMTDFPNDATYSTLVTSNTTVHDNGIDIFGATGTTFPFFTTILGTVSNLNLLSSNIGNGTFKAGIWENGVWNNGWRVDDNVCDFNEIEYAIKVESDTRWRIQLSGPTSSVAKFEIGDKVSIGNIIAIDINENRKLIKSLHTIINKNESNIIIDVTTAFPFRRIEKDSLNHKIRVTKNVWLNGGFLNGYFEGIWNNGLVKGYPYLTEMYNTHWIDGTFDGGHYHSEYPGGTFSDTFYVDSNSMGIDPVYNTKLGLTFSEPHNLLPGDVIIIDKYISSLNPGYNGESTVTYVVDDTALILNKSFGLSSTLEGGNFKRKTATGVIQNFRFFDNNVGSSPTASNTDSKFLFNSWIDVNYSTQSASTINKNQISFDTDNGEYSNINLYGNITEDILSSVSSFRDSSTFNKQIYSLGTKYKIYEDFLGDISEFNEPFGTNPGLGGLSSFFNNGWTFSIIPPDTTVATFSRTDDEKLKIEIYRPISQSKSILNNNNILINKKRYSLIEFNIDDYKNIPSIYLNTNQPQYLPNMNRVNHIMTNNIKKQEYFFNRNKLSLLINSIGNGYVILDNIKFYEVDMIPFFQYTTIDYVNGSVQIPYIGKSPVIDYVDSNFSFIENIEIGLDSVSIDVTISNSNNNNILGNIISVPAENDQIIGGN